MKKAFLSLLAACILFLTPLAAYADSNYKEYIYNTSGEAVAAPASYQPFRVLYGDEETALPFSSPQDIACDEAGRLYVLDSGNDRIVVLDQELRLAA